MIRKNTIFQSSKGLDDASEDVESILIIKNGKRKFSIKKESSKEIFMDQSWEDFAKKKKSVTNTENSSQRQFFLGK